MEARVLSFWAYCCISLSRSPSRLFIYLASRRLTFMPDHPLVCGLFFGMAVELVMSYVVLPLSALQARGPYRLHDILLGLIVHMIVIGLPVAYSVRRFARWRYTYPVRYQTNDLAIVTILPLSPPLTF